MRSSCAALALISGHGTVTIQPGEGVAATLADVLTSVSSQVGPGVRIAADFTTGPIWDSVTINRDSVTITGGVSMTMMFVSDAIEAYAAEQESLGLASGTLRGQLGFVRRFGRVCEEEAVKRGKRSPLKASEIDVTVITAYFATCTGGQGNRNNMTVSLGKFIAWLELADALPYGARARLLGTRKYKKATRQPKHYIPVGQFGDALDISGERHPEDRIVVALALYTLCRCGEITGIPLGKLNLAGQVVGVYREKRKRWTDVAICPELEAELDVWLRWYAEAAGYGNFRTMIAEHPDWKLVPRLINDWLQEDRGRFRGLAACQKLDPLNSPTHLERVVKRALTALGADTVDGRGVRHWGEGMHTFRRSGARAMLDYLSLTRGHDRALLEVATMLDHEDTKETLRYIGLDQQREQLNDWLKTNSMYGTGENNELLRVGNGRVVPLRRVSSDVRQHRAV